MKKIIMCFVCVLVTFVFFGVDCFANNKTLAAYNAFRTNATYTGKLFQVGLMGNYYKVQTLGPSNSYATHTTNVCLMNISNEYNCNTSSMYMNHNYECNVSDFVAFDAQTTRGYEYLFMYGAGIRDNDNYTDSQTSQNSFPAVYGNTTLYSSDIVPVDDKTVLYNNLDTSYSKVVVCLFADVAKGDITCKQYQSWWWGDQEIWNLTSTAYFVSNISIGLRYYN